MHTHIGSSRLVRSLSAWGPKDAALGAPAAGTARQDVAQRLAQWLSVPDAIALHGAHQSIRAVPAATARHRPGRADTAAVALDTELQRLRDTLAAAIVQAPPAKTAGKPRHGRSALATAAPAASAAEEPDFAPWRQRCVDIQRQMELRVDALRAHARQVLAQAGGALAQLALLDAAMDPMLAGRRQRLMASLPDFLERRFEQLRKAQTDTPAGQPIAPMAWRLTFQREWQDLMLAELELRLQPVCGLVEAWLHAPTRHA